MDKFEEARQGLKAAIKDATGKYASSIMTSDIRYWRGQLDALRALDAQYFAPYVNAIKVSTIESRLDSLADKIATLQKDMGEVKDSIMSTDSDLADIKEDIRIQKRAVDVSTKLEAALRKFMESLS